MDIQPHVNCPIQASPDRKASLDETVQSLASRIRIDGFHYKGGLVAAGIREAGAVDAAPPILLLFENKDGSAKLHVRLTYTAVDLGGELISWDFEGLRDDPERRPLRRADLTIRTYRNFIINVVQTAADRADAETTERAIAAIGSVLREHYRTNGREGRLDPR